MKTTRIILALSISGFLLAQTSYTLPNNAWRVTVKQTSSSGNWKGNRNYSGVGPQEFILSDYGRRYYDHVHPEAWYDFYDLDSLQVSANSTLSEYIREFNQSQSATFWNDTLPDYTTEFFGTDSVVIGGLINNTLLKHVVSRQDFQLDYGVSNKVTFSLLVPHFSLVEEKRGWSWSPYEIPGLEDFLAYHTAAREQFADFESFFSSFPMNADTLDKLLSIRDRFYTADGSNSVLWALAGGTDPAGTAINGQAYNPFATDDTTATTIDSLITWYLPDYRTTSGLGDITIKLSFLVAGKPAWSQQSFFSAYSSVGIQLPLGRRLSKFSLTSLDSTGRPEQFSDYPLGSGSTKFSVGFFGEFYTRVSYWDVVVNWDTELGISTREFHNFPVSMLGTNLTSTDSIQVHFPDKYGFRPGGEWRGTIAGRLELWPDRLSVGGRLAAYFKARDKYYSVDEDWAEYMQFRVYADKTVYDTRITMVTPSVSLYIQNLHPLKKIGPVPFEIEIGGSKPIITRHTFSDFSLWVGFITYFQAW